MEQLCGSLRAATSAGSAAGSAPPAPEPDCQQTGTKHPSPEKEEDVTFFPDSSPEDEEQPPKLTRVEDGHVVDPLAGTRAIPNIAGLEVGEVSKVASDIAFIMDLMATCGGPAQDTQSLG